MRGDLHIHTCVSDGSYTHRDALLLARERGLSYVSFVDHDTVEGNANASALGAEFGVTVIPGLEISAQDPVTKRKVHILGYGYCDNPLNIRALCDPLIEARNRNTLRQLEILQRAGYPVDLSRVRAIAPGATVFYKQHIMQVLIDSGLESEIYGELYHELFKEGGIASGDIHYPDAHDAVSAIVADGGIAVLAHPGQFDSWALVPSLAEAGLCGIEYLHEAHRSEDYKRVLSLASQYDLILTGGSDDHGTLGSVIHIGDINSPDDLLLALLSRDHPSMKVALSLVVEAGKRLRKACAEMRVTETKDNNHQDLVTKWDTDIEAYIVSSLSKEFPEDSFITEEQSLGAGWEGPHLPAGRVWILDPIDGTANFAGMGRDYSVSLALYANGLSEMGLVFDCEREILYTAVAGKGAKINGRPISKDGAEKNNFTKGLRDATVDLSLNSIEYLKGHGADFSGLNKAFRGHRASGCASLSICRVADGTLDAYISAKLGIWDWAAAWLVLTESGSCAWEGPVRGKDIGVRSKRLYVAAGNEKLGEALLEYLCGPEYRAGIERLEAEISR